MVAREEAHVDLLTWLRTVVLYLIYRRAANLGDLWYQLVSLGKNRMGSSRHELRFVSEIIITPIMMIEDFSSFWRDHLIDHAQDDVSKSRLLDTATFC